MYSSLLPLTAVLCAAQSYLLSQ